MNLPPEIIVFFTAALPISELRGAIPLGVLTFKFPLWKSFLISATGNLTPVIPLLIFLSPFEKFSEKNKYLKKFFGVFKKRGLKNRKLIEKYELLGVYLFVAVPLPLTGAWTGALLSYLFSLPPLPSFVSISLGVLSAGFIVSGIVFAGVKAGILIGIITAIFIVLLLNYLLPK